MSGHVYFIGPHWKHGLVKIGYTRAGVYNRLNDLQTGSPYPLEVFAYLVGDIKLERVFHETFAPLRLHREWFRMDMKLMAMVSSWEGSGIERRPVTDAEFRTAMHEIITNDEPPFDDITPEQWIDTCDAGVLSSWECDLAWAEYVQGRAQ